MSYPPGFFTYTLSPATVPISGTGQSVVQLMLAVANNTGHDIVCDQIGITIVAGKGGGQLTESVDDIESSATPGTRWSARVDAGNITWSPDVGHETLHAGESVAFLISNIHVNEVAGLAALTIYETTDVTRVAQVEVTKSAAGLGISSFMVSSVQVNPGQAATLTWTTMGAARCTLSPGQGQVDLNGSQQVRPDATMTYTLTAEGKGAAITAQVTVVVPDVRVLNFDATPDQVVKGAITHLTWDVLGASNAVIDPGRLKVDPTDGSLDLIVDENTRFVLRASSPTRSDSQERSVDVVPVKIASFSADPAVVTVGNATKLSWATEGASGCAIEPGVGDVPVVGSKYIQPTTSTVYELHADGLGPQMAEVAVGVGAAITLFGLDSVPGKTDEAQVAWAAFVAGGGSVTLTLPGGQPKSVPPTGAASVKLVAGQWVTVRLVVTTGPTTATASFALSGPLVGPSAEFTKLLLTCPAGINTPRATATIQWVATKGVVHGRMVNAGGRTHEVDGASGSVQFGTGRRPPRVDLWKGDLQIGDVPRIHWQVV